MRLLFGNRVARVLLVAVLSPLAAVMHKADQRMVPKVVPTAPDPPLSDQAIASICDRYFEVHAYLASGRGDEEPEDLVRLSMEIDDMGRNDPERLWPIVTVMIDRVPDEATLWFVAAGPLENLVSWHGPRFLDRLEQRAGSNRLFRYALRGVWGWQRFPRRVRERLYPILSAEDDPLDLPQRP